MKTIELYDTTMRDGMQGIEVNFTLADKIKIAHKLDEMKIDFIEGGFPLSSKKETSFFNQIKKEKFDHAKIVAFGSTRKPGIKASEDPHIQALVKTEIGHLAIVGKAWKAHVEQVLGTDINENLEIINDSISYLKKKGHIIIFDLEHFFDGFKDDSQYALKILETASKAGAQTLVLCDTNGGTMPSEVVEILKQIPKDTLAPLGVHFHNDCGTAVANSLLSLDYGANHIQGTINGWGERCGNANLCTLVPDISLKTNYKINISSELHKITSLSRYVYEIANIIPEKRQPYVGEAAFSHKAGQHADVINKAPQLMEHIDSKLVGNSRDILLSELSGKSTIINKLTKYGKFDKKSVEVQELIDVLKKKEEEGYEYETATASFDILIRKVLKQYKPIIELNSYHLESFKTGNLSSKTVGRIFISSDSKNMMGAAVSIGPVDTLDRSLRDALTPHYPFLKKINLIDYKVRILDPESAAGAKVRVFITSTDHKIEWGTVGVSENIVEASWEALVDSFDYYYNNIFLNN
ncbi:MAG: citramalate synthase [Spirochaetaceae bacterium]|nr:citramalate synthase [Spirochaetaceae bacterium]